jgi:hypothetical protein
LKVKRKVVEQHFAREIEAMYAEDDETSSTTHPRSTPAAAG